ncbi:hypothetical protein ACIQFZ_30010 [Streptomyces sp. NPDC093064]
MVVFVCGPVLVAAALVRFTTKISRKVLDSALLAGVAALLVASLYAELWGVATLAGVVFDLAAMARVMDLVEAPRR